MLNMVERPKKKKLRLSTCDLTGDILLRIPESTPNFLGVPPWKFDIVDPF